MGLDIYVGTLTRYLAGDWELVAQSAAKELGLSFQVIRQHDPEDAIRDPDELRPVVEQWRTNLSNALTTHLSSPLDWNEKSLGEYFTDKPAWDGYAALILWAAYEEQRQFVRPINAVEEWGGDPAYAACADSNFNSRYFHLYNVGLWLPCDFRFVFEADFVTGSEMNIGSSIALAKQLDELNRRTWQADSETLQRWRRDGSDHGAPLETAAKFAFSVFRYLADQSVSHRLPMLMDF